MIPQHLSLSNEHYTPLKIVESARRVLGEIDLDPASSAKANEVVRARKYYTQEVNGLAQPWNGRVFLNPPGGRAPKNVAGIRGHAALWWDSLSHNYETRLVSSAIFVGFTLEILRTTQSLMFPVIHYPFCIPRDRMVFSGSNPTHANVIVYLGDDPELFEAEFEKHGEVRK